MVEVTCKNCDGNGEYYTDVAVIDYVNGGFFDDKLVTCEECDGHGEIDLDT